MERKQAQKSVYLHDIPLEEALERFNAALSEHKMAGILGSETIPVDENAVGQVLAEPVWAKLSSPHYHASAMDGFAIKAVETVGAKPSSPVIIELGEHASYVDTGDPLPDWADSVIPIENTEPIGEDGIFSSELRNPKAIRIRASIPPWSNVRPMGEDIVASQLVLPSGSTLRAVDLGAIAASGNASVCVSIKPRVGIIPTGTELVGVGTSVKKGDIIEFNSIVLAAQVNTWGGNAHRYPITTDDFSRICDQVEQAADESDLVLLNAGSSAGSEDYSADVIAKLGFVLVHGIAVRPGHPVILGMVHRKNIPEDGRDWIPVIGVPGYPVSAAITSEIIVQPLINRWLGRADPNPAEIEAISTRKITSPAGDDDYIRVVVGRVGERILAAPLARGAGVITSLVRADGITILPRGTQGVEANSKIKVQLYRPLHEIDRTIFAIGSHDMTLDILAQFLSMRSRRLVSANVGSQGGLIAIRRHEAHLAGSHLMDPETGEYNVSYIPQYLNDIPIKLVTWVHRQQGLMVNRGNPKKICSLEDLQREDVLFVNRQRGAGTRVLLDFNLHQLGIMPEKVRGYDHEEYTHLAVAASVASGRASCGLGIPAAANALNLDFVPLYEERYDLIIPSEYVEGEFLAPIFDLMQDGKFRQAILQLPGYNINHMGEFVN